MNKKERLAWLPDRVIEMMRDVVRDAGDDAPRVELHTGDHARIHRLFASEFAAVYRLACVASGYTPDSVQTYNPRVISGSDRLSMHSYGVAVDFDPPLNPMGGIIRATNEHSIIRRHIMFAEVWEWAGWTWGGRWSMRDDMHFQRKR